MSDVLAENLGVKGEPIEEPEIPEDEDEEEESEEDLTEEPEGLYDPEEEVPIFEEGQGEGADEQQDFE